MDCDQAKHLMPAHLGGIDTPAEWQALRHHLRSCPACQAEAEGFTETWNALATLPDAEVPARVWQRIQSRLPVPVGRAARNIPWAAAAAVLGVLVSIAASWLLPYERAVRLCSERLRDFFAAPLPDPATAFGVGILYGLLPLGLTTLVAARWLSHTGRHPGICTGLLFGGLVVPYVIIACGGLPALFTAALMAGILAGGLAGGPAGIWAGGKFLRPARAT